MAQQAPPAIPMFQPQDIAHITQAEWNQYTADVGTYLVQITTLIHGVSPNVAIEIAPAALNAGPTAPTARLAGSIKITVWLYHLRAQYNQEVANAALAVAHAAMMAPPPPPPVVNNAHLIQLLQQMANMQQQVNLFQAQQAVAPRAGPCIKPDTPAKYLGESSKATAFIDQCENYFAFDPPHE